MTLKSLKIRRFFFWGGEAWRGCCLYRRRLLDIPATGRQTPLRLNSSLRHRGGASLTLPPLSAKEKKAGNLKFPRFLFTVGGLEQHSVQLRGDIWSVSIFSWYILECFVKQKRWSDSLDAVVFVTNKWQGTRQGHIRVHTVYVRTENSGLRTLYSDTVTKSSFLQLAKYCTHMRLFTLYNQSAHSWRIAHIGFS